MSELFPCPFCGSEHVNLNGYDIHKVRCSNNDCYVSSVAFSKDQWNKRYLTGKQKAAPEMYDLLQEASDFLESMHYLDVDITIKNSIELKKKVSNLLAKARGES